MKYYELTKEEKGLLKVVEGDKLKSRAKSELDKFRLLAKNTLDKNRNINIRLSARDLAKLRVKAIEKGMPYQTLATSVLHQYVDSDRD